MLLVLNTLIFGGYLPIFNPLILKGMLERKTLKEKKKALNEKQSLKVKGSKQEVILIRIYTF